jgi:hypothetical protein
MSLSPLIPHYYAAPENFEMFGIRHSRTLLLLRLTAPILAQTLRRGKPPDVSVCTADFSFSPEELWL